MAITLSEAATSNRDWRRLFDFDASFDGGETFEPIDFTGAFIAIAIYDQYGCHRILATSDNGKIIITAPGMFELYVPASEFTLCPSTYQIGAYYQLNGDTIDLFEGSLSVRRGIPKP